MANGAKPYEVNPQLEELGLQSAPQSIPEALGEAFTGMFPEVQSSGVPARGKTSADYLLAELKKIREEGEATGRRQPIPSPRPPLAGLPTASAALPEMTSAEPPPEQMMSMETPEAIDARIAFNQLLELGFNPNEAQDAGRFAKVDELMRRYGAASSYEAEEVGAARENLAQAEENFLNVENDPYAFVRDGKNKVLAIVGMVFGAAASGFTGGKMPNQAMQLFNKFVDMEFKKGIEEKGKLRDLMNVANQRLNNEVVASNMARSALMSGLSKQIDAELRKIGLDQQADAISQQAAAFKQKTEAEALKALMPDRKEQDAIVNKRNEAKTSLALIDKVDKYLTTSRDPKTKGKLFTVDSDLVQRFRNALVYSVDKNDNVFADGFLASLSEKYAGTQEAFKLLRQMAFNMAAQGQSASSISDKDVNNFLKVLANPARTVEQIQEALQPFRVKAQHAEYFNQLQIDNPGLSPFQASKLADKEYPFEMTLKPVDLTGLRQFIVEPE